MPADAVSQADPNLGRAVVEDSKSIDYGEVRTENRLDLNRLASYLRSRLPDADGPLTLAQFHGGHSNLTYLLKFGQREWVLRRPPVGPLPRGGHDMAREYRVLSRLADAYPMAPRAVLFCEDSAVIGAPFFIMERRHGVCIRKREPLPVSLAVSPSNLRRISEGFIDALADLHRVDFIGVGLEHLGRPEGFFARQVKGWMERWERAKTREVPLMNRLGTWLGTHAPPPQPPAILHNDFFLHNVMFHRVEIGRVEAVLDWEMSTLGDPMVDLGITLGYWRDPDDPPSLLALNPVENHTLERGFLRRDELSERYARRTGRDLGQIDFYLAFAFWRTAIVIEQLYARFARGMTNDERYAKMAAEAPVLAETARIIASRIGFDLPV